MVSCDKRFLNLSYHVSISMNYFSGFEDFSEQRGFWKSLLESHVSNSFKILIEFYLVNGS